MQKSGPIKRNFDISLALLKILGLWMDGEEGFFETKFYWMYSIFANVLIGGCFILGMFMYLFTNIHNFDLVTGNAYLVLAISIPAVKSVFFLKGLPRVKYLVKQLDQAEFQPKNKYEKQMVSSNFKAFRAINIILASTVIFLAPLWLISPLIVHSEEPKLPFLSWYPFDFRSPPYFTVAYLHQALGLFYCALLEWNLDLVIFGFMACLATECDILSNRLRNVFSGQSMEDELIWHMRHHWKILKFAEDANKLLGTLTFVQLAVSNLANCMCMFQLSVLPPLSIQFFVVLQVQAAILAQLLVYCYFGNNVLSKSLEISDALYSMPWIDGSRSFKKNTLFFLMRTQRPIKILALNVFLLSLPTFTYVMRSSYSFFAMLHQTQLKKIT